MPKSAWLLAAFVGLWSCAGSTANEHGAGGSETGGAGTAAGGRTSEGGSSLSGGTAARAGSGGSGTAGVATGGSASGSSNGGFSGGGSVNGGGSSLADVQAIFDGRCVNCHDKSKMGLPTYGQLSLVAADTLAALVNKPATEPCGATLVVPGDPERSYLIHKLNDATPCDGMRMPRPFEVLPSPPLTPEQMTTIRSWISAGANP